MGDGGTRRKLVIHGPIVEIDCTVPLLDPLLDAALGPFAVKGWPARFVPISGIIQPYNPEEIARRLPASALPHRVSPDVVEYHDADRAWLVDDRFGAVEVNSLRHQFRAWVTPSPRVEAGELVDAVITRPLGQLLRRHGLHCLPGISVVRDGFALLMPGSHAMEAELMVMMANGYHVIGQRQTAVRAEDGRVALLHLPGGVPLNACGPHLTASDAMPWNDLTEGHPGSRQNHAFCDAVVFVEPERAPRAALSPLAEEDVASRLHDAWAANAGSGGFERVIADLASQASGFTLRLSRNCKELLGLLNSARSTARVAERHAVAA